MSCVTLCDDLTQTQITDAQMHSIPLCRSYEYFIDPTSKSVVELGTINHPYKDFESVMVELLNFHTHNDRTINIYIMEDVITYWVIAESYFSDITLVNVQSYSKITAAPNKANIVGVTDTSHRVAAGVPTKFGILGKINLNIF
jgi:hypothetical protein